MLVGPVGTESGTAAGLKEERRRPKNGFIDCKPTSQAATSDFFYQRPSNVSIGNQLHQRYGHVDAASHPRVPEVGGDAQAVEHRRGLALQVAPDSMEKINRLSRSRKTVEPAHAIRTYQPAPLLH